jgi:hypothetical protein
VAKDDEVCVCEAVRLGLGVAVALGVDVALGVPVWEAVCAVLRDRPAPAPSRAQRLLLLAGHVVATRLFIHLHLGRRQIRVVWLLLRLLRGAVEHAAHRFLLLKLLDQTRLATVWLRHIHKVKITLPTKLLLLLILLIGRLLLLELR